MNHLLSATILLFAVWPLYYLLLRYSDRYSLNRLLLLLVMVAVVTLPFINFSSPAPVVTQRIQGTISYLEEGVITGGASIDLVPKEIRYDEKGDEIHLANRTATTIFLLPKMYYLGLGLLTLVLGFRLLFLLALHLRSRLNGDGSYRLLHPRAKPGQAFTFGRNLYFSIDVPDNPDFEHILTHERVHARQFHSLDILLSEVFLCIFWFHPAAWWLRAKMRANLEFLVDKAVVSSGADRRDYQLALVRQSQGAYGLALALPFSEPSLKSRITRMTGLPQYRVVALVAAVALVFWLGAGLLLVKGSTFAADVPLSELRPTPQERLEKLLGVASPGIGPSSFSRLYDCDCTFREWYEDLGFPNDQPVLTYYNDREVSLDFLLDTNFGENAMIHHGVIYDTHMGRYALQVVDDYPDITVFFAEVPEADKLNETDNEAGIKEAGAAMYVATLQEGDPVELDLFFKRLPMPSEVDQINRYLERLTGKKITVFQDCTKPAGDYSLQLSKEGNSSIGFETWPAGSRRENPVRLRVTKNGSGGSGGAAFRPSPLPEDAPNGDVLLRVNGVWLSLYATGGVVFTPATLDPAPLPVSLRCLLELNPENAGKYNVWTATRTSFSHAKVGEEVRELLRSQELEGVPIRYFVGEGEVSAAVFARQPAKTGARLSMASRTEGPEDRVVARLDY